MDEKWGWSGAVGAAIVVSIFACIAISASGGWPIVQGAFVWIANWVDGVNGSTWASWAQAVGSVAAVWVALKLATKGDKRKHQEDLDRAALVAARLSQLVDGDAKGSVALVEFG